MLSGSRPDTPRTRTCPADPSRGDGAEGDPLSRLPGHPATCRAPHRAAARAPSPLPGESPQGGPCSPPFPRKIPTSARSWKNSSSGFKTSSPPCSRRSASQDLPELARLAHWLKGAGGTAGFPAFTQPAKHLESLVQDQQCDEIEAAVAELLQWRSGLPCPAKPALRTGESFVIALSFRRVACRANGNNARASPGPRRQTDSAYTA